MPGFVPSPESLELSLGTLQRAYARVAGWRETLHSDLSDRQVADLAMMHGLTALHMANEPDLPVGQGRFGGLISAAAPIRERLVPTPGVRRRRNVTSLSPLIDAAEIPYVSPAEAYRLAADELRCLLALLASLDEGDWSKPTACTLWSVRDILAHQAGAYASGTGYRELIHQYSTARNLRRLPEDSINELQLAERAGRSPAELMAELAASGDQAVHNWAYGFRLFKLLGTPHPLAGWLSMRYLMLVTHSRDTWIHRLDICRAAGRPFEQTREHDGRIVELVVRDLGRSLSRKLGGRAIALQLAGIAGGNWRIGPGEPAATIQMDTLDFNLYASGRFSYDEAAARAAFSGEGQLAELAFRNFSVLY